ncbi:putative AAA ATPase family protein [Lyophyllum shimeji]|uniref:AAA ATPase family protein n=1 Tax=Lyophyllum shimeji TaxID=47721 RepID=A0A9P3UQW5_LYOSH|nr:putative AAA ATPase family protein [Lyophyllum shimeji]
MASYLVPTLQQAFCGVVGSNISPNVTDTATGISPATTQPQSILGFLFSFTALQDWLKLIVIGGVLESSRRLFYSAYNKFVNSFFITAIFDDGDDSYDWMMVWLSKHPSWAEAREIQISTNSFGLKSSAVLIPGEDEGASDLVQGSRKLAYMPRVSTTQSLWFRRRWVTVTRSQEPSGYYSRPEDRLTIRIMTRHHRVLNELLQEAKREYKAALEHSITIYVSDSSNCWRNVASRPKRPLRSIVLDPGIKDLLIDDAKDFLGSKPWYAARGIPFRRGYLLYGAPGSGKTSIIHSLAGELGLDVYIISLSRVGMDDNALSELISELPEKCIALMEDIDAAFTQTLNRDDEPSESGPGERPDGPHAREPPKSTSRVSLSGLLNALDGVGAQEGRILFATTNKYGALDPALCRPGRMDVHIEFKLASQFQARELYRYFYLPEEDEGAECEDDDGSGKESLGSGYAKSTNLIDLDPASDSSEKPSTASIKVSPRGNGNLSRAPKLSHREILQLASRFADAIPERQFSMASLQGYLMGYKTRPLDAVNDVAAWVEKEQSKKTTATANLDDA